MGHTPTPWTLSDVRQPDAKYPSLLMRTIYGASREYFDETAGVCDGADIVAFTVSHVDQSGGWANHAEEEANAVHIVRCVNAHDELVAEVKKQIAWLEHMKKDARVKLPESFQHGLEQSLKYLGNVLAKAEGK